MITFYNRTFKELRENTDLGFRDPYGIAASLTEEMKEAVLHNPSGYRDEEVCQILALDDDKVVGCTNPFSGRVWVDDEIVYVQQGSILFSHEDYRKENVGGELFIRISTLHPQKNNLYSGISHMAIGLYRALKYSVFEYPRLIYLKRSRSVIHSLLKSECCLVAPLIWISDFVLFLHRTIIKLYCHLKFSKYTFEECNKVPQEVEDIIKEDTHPFKEVHDKAWFEWNIKYQLTSEPRVKKLFVIKDHGNIVGFFMTKEQFFKQASSRGFKNVTLGTIVEWGISDSCKLTEKDLYLLSIPYFSKNVDGIQYATGDYSLVKSLKKYLFVTIGTANLGVKFKLKDNRLKDINNWRFRIGCSDTILN